MAYLSSSTNGQSPFQKLLGYNASILEQWNKLEESFFASVTFNASFKEEIRRVLAYIHQCHYCMAKGAPSQIINDPKLRKAIEFAKAIAENHHHISEDMINGLKNYFSEAEISELCAFICFISAAQKFGAVLGLRPSTCSL